MVAGRCRREEGLTEVGPAGHGSRYHPDMAEIPGFTRSIDKRHPGLPIYYITNEREAPTSMVVLMPASLSATRADRDRIHYHRWKWQDSWPESLVVVMPDPALQQSTKLNGAWFLHPEIDVVAAIADVVSDVAAAARIPQDRIVFYGSSLGGFGAISCAAHLPGARAVAEVPQVYFEKWHPVATRLVEEHVTKGPIAGLRDEFPERLSLPARISFANLVPPMHLISNATDKSIDDQHAFMEWGRRSGLPRIGEQSLELLDLVEGHRAIPRSDLVARLTP